MSRESWRRSNEEQTEWTARSNASFLGTGPKMVLGGIEDQRKAAAEYVSPEGYKGDPFQPDYAKQVAAHKSEKELLDATEPVTNALTQVAKSLSTTNGRFDESKYAAIAPILLKSVNTYKDTSGELRSEIKLSEPMYKFLYGDDKGRNAALNNEQRGILDKHLGYETKTTLGLQKQAITKESGKAVSKNIVRQVATGVGSTLKPKLDLGMQLQNRGAFDQAKDITIKPFNEKLFQATEAAKQKLRQAVATSVAAESGTEITDPRIATELMKIQTRELTRNTGMTLANKLNDQVRDAAKKGETFNLLQKLGVGQRYVANQGQQFNTPEEAESSGLPAGTVVTVSGRPYSIDGPTKGKR